MMDRGSIILLGNGPSARSFDWLPWRGVPVAAVSGGINACPCPPAYFITYDRPTFYPQRYVEPACVQKHVPHGKGLFWLNYHNVVHWHYDVDQTLPTFRGQRFAKGPGQHPNSLIMAVQIVAMMGYTRCHFVGCDLLEECHAETADVLRLWLPVAESHGIEWLNMSPDSALSYFMPCGLPLLEEAA